MNGRRLLALLALALTTSCDRAAPTSPAGAPGAPGASLVSDGPLLACAPQPAASASATIGPDGGTLQVGPHTLSIPPGALAAPVTIAAVAPSASVVRVDFEPHGLAFAEPATLTLSYAQCGAIYSLWPKRIAYTTDAQAILEYLLSHDHLLTRRVTGRLEHFSTYAVAW
jgi:hypothetical protein